MATASVKAFRSFGRLSAKSRADLLDLIAERLSALEDQLVPVTHQETHLPLPRLKGELARTTGQLKMFANLLRDGSWLDVRIDTADPTRAGSPKPDIRRTQVPLGPVAIFGASNFPYAFSTAGGDVASALAAGCTVLYKAHPAHPQTNGLVAQVIRQAIADQGLDLHVFEVVWGDHVQGLELVKAPEIEAVGFTGSHRAGRAIYDACSQRSKPIPVYAEMGSVNPVFVASGAAKNLAYARGYAQSLTLGAGQFCTDPGLLIGIDSPDFDAFTEEVARALSEVVPASMLTEQIEEGYRRGIEERAKRLKARLFEGAALFETAANAFLENEDLHEELFGPAGIVIRCSSPNELLKIAEVLKGQLTTAILFEESDKPFVYQLLPLLTEMAGRVIANGFPTGLEVNSSMHHGGPYPATTDSRSTSVGTAAIYRFVRPVAFQGFPDEVLPDELKAVNPLGLARQVDGKREPHRT